MVRVVTILCITFLSTFAGTMIRFKESAEISGNQILLSDIAQISGDHSDFFDTLTIAKTAGPGMKQYVAGEQELVYTFIPDSIRAGIRISGAARTAVISKGVKVLYTTLEDRIRLLIRDSISWKNYRIEFNNREDQSLYLFSDEQFELKLLRMHSRYKRGRTQLTLQVSQQGWKSRFPMTVHVKVSETVAIAKRDMKRGERLYQKDVHYRLVDISDLPFEPITSSSQIKRTQLTGYAKKGQVLSSSKVEKVPDVVQGSDIRILFNNGKVTISAMGRARQSGSIGDIILVENSKSHKVIKGKIIRTGLVRVTSGGAV